MTDATQERGQLSAETTPVGASMPWNHVLFRRRRFLVHRRYQLRVTAVAVGTTFVLLLLVNFTLFAANQKATLTAVHLAPELRPYFAAQDRFQIGLIALGSLAFLAGVFLLGVLETHRTAGASLNLCRCLDQLKDGRYALRARLRRGDNLKEIELALNELAAALQEKALRDAALLEAMAGRAERISVPDASALAKEIRHLAGEKHLLAE